MATEPSTLELEDIQNGALHPRPSPYVGVYILLRIDQPQAGRELLRRLLPALASATDPADRDKQAWVSAGLTFQGLKALGVPQTSLDSFPEELQQGMAARAELLGDVGESAPEHWESPLGTQDVHVALAALSPDADRLEAVIHGARPRQLPRAVRHRSDLAAGRLRPGGRAHLLRLQRQPQQSGRRGQRHPRHQPPGGAHQGGRVPPWLPERNGRADPAAAARGARPKRHLLGLRKLHTRVAAYRQYLRAKARNRAEEEVLAAKIVGRWPSGAPLALAPDKDDPELGDDPVRSNDFLYQADDPRGLKCPLGAHARRMNPRDASIIGVPRLHRLIRRSTSYGPMLPEGVLEDDGGDRGIIFVAAGARLDRQFEFVKTQWINDGLFFGSPDDKDPLVGPNDGSGQFTIPQRPIRRRLTDLPGFVVNRGGEYCFIPSLSALRWLSELDT